MENRKELYQKIRHEVERVIESGFGEVKVVVSANGDVVDVISSPIERFRATMSGYYASNTNTATDN